MDKKIDVERICREIRMVEEENEEREKKELEKQTANDLVQENRVLKKALELACEEIVSRDGDTIIPQDESLESYVEEYIQQAKESEKDERI